MSECEREFKGNVILRVRGFRARGFEQYLRAKIRKVTKNIVRESFVRIQYVKKIVREHNLRKLLKGSFEEHMLSEKVTVSYRSTANVRKCQEPALFRRHDTHDMYEYAPYVGESRHRR